MFCEKCGKELPDGVKFCSGCGAPQNPQQNTFNQQQQYSAQPDYGYNQQQQYSAQPDYGYNQQQQYNAQTDYGYAQQQYAQQPGYYPPKKKGHGLLVVLILLFIVVVGFGSLYFIFPTPQKAVEKWFEAVKDLEFDEAAKYMDSKSAAALHLLSSYEDDAYGVFGDLFAGVELEDVEADYGDDANIVTDVFNKYFADECTVYVTVSYDGDEEVLELPMINEGIGDWKIDGGEIDL
ncbi:zinc ribbon domain-containing protein [Pseudobutyrivibrio sp.]|uniref:zinc ribbon domain-containing protein n=1 Tax=Pseudobutyrivibrio sp. TaxID=2014367 RepID=UPI001DE8596A|nr:zinc ribbon domain-containing protein [Pseudobutyrivibrio sp.]MBE5912054.1 zinc ribbon domain-containing protein [Pseudobutyrivibrio sp.]